MAVGKTNRRFCVTVSTKLLRQIDAAAGDEYISRSAAVRQAMAAWLNDKPRRARLSKEAGQAEPPPRSAYESLSAEQKEVLAAYKKGGLIHADLITAGITPELQIDLMAEREL